MSQYFIAGFRLLIKGREFYLISLVLGTASLLFVNYVKDVGWIGTTILGYLSAVYLILSPKFFKDKQEGVKISVSKIINLVLKHSLKLIIPFFLFILLMILIMTLLVVFLSGMLFNIINPSIGFDMSLESLFTQLVRDFSQPFNLYAFFLSFISFPLTFFSIYYSVEGKGVVTSVKNSIKTSFKHLEFVFVINALYFILDSLSYYLPEEPFWGQLFRGIGSDFILFWLCITTTLIYYQKKIANK